ncbi:SGNH hydrolase [Polyplosphaeria fusca]|uniref:SGNH hydrolase n=1 Tax=Polyplosphaeria fusca TaxID=682080 RepID=A0A9P4UTK3_9PLEO|nr:SGNH hydrolase [Polyplosphaeria fusca]
MKMNIFFLLATYAAAIPLEHHYEKRNDLVYKAFGDSYSAGPGAGKGRTFLNKCRRYGGSYPKKLGPKINGKELDDKNFFSCTGAETPAIMKQGQDHLDGSEDVVTVSLGGNNVGFGQIVNNCVFRFVYVFGIGGFGDACDKTLKNSWDKIKSNLDGPVKDALQVYKDKTTKAQIIVTGYPRFWNDQMNTDKDSCTTSWNVYPNLPTTVDTTPTKAIRKEMNDMVNEVNRRIGEVVKNLGSDRIHFVDYNDRLEGGRFCEDDVVDPQKPGESRPELRIGQYQTKLGQFAPDDDEWMDATEDLEDFANSLLQQNTTLLDGEEIVATEQSLAPAQVQERDITILLKEGVVRVFHPTQLGHQNIADAVEAKLRELNVPLEGTAPPPSCPASRMRRDGTCSPPAPPTGTLGPKICIGNMPANFPNSWFFTDATTDTRNLMYRLRDEICGQGNKCTRIKGVNEGQYVVQPNAGGGAQSCAAAVKVGADKEVYGYGSNPGQNCWDAMAILIDQCAGNQHKWMTTDVPNELYQLGFRDLNPNDGNSPGSDHPLMSTLNIHHVPYQQVACKIESKTWVLPLSSVSVTHDIYSIATQNFAQVDDIKAGIEKNCHQLISWSASGDNVYTFPDANANTNFMTFEVDQSRSTDYDCIRNEVASHFQLPAGSLTCGQDYKNVDRMH